MEATAGAAIMANRATAAAFIVSASYVGWGDKVGCGGRLRVVGCDRNETPRKSQAPYGSPKEGLGFCTGTLSIKRIRLLLAGSSHTPSALRRQ
jgi:hypothetical protein